MRITTERDDDNNTCYLATERRPSGRLIMAEGETRRAAAAAIFEMLGCDMRATWLAIQEQFGPAMGFDNDDTTTDSGAQ